MKLRVISSIIAILILFLFLFYLPFKYFYYLVFLLVILLELELHKLLFKRITFYFFYTLIFVILLFISYINTGENLFFQLFTITILLSFSFIVFKFNNFSSTVNNIVKFLFSIIYIPMIAIYVFLIYNKTNGNLLLLHLLIICWATDSFAFLTGKNFGNRKLFPAVSPQKTVEGFIGGVAGGIIFGLFGVLFVPFCFFKNFYISLIISLACVIGDLFESAIKRKFNVKDSGSFFPGHGGILDRVDGVLFAIPLYYFLIN